VCGPWGNYHVANHAEGNLVFVGVWKTDVVAEAQVLVSALQLEVYLRVSANAGEGFSNKQNIP
jgi:hypothetical protein